jgi:hypothetical protein
MLLRWLRKDNAFWDIAVVAMLLNVLVQVNCFMMPNSGPDGIFGYDSSLWCSIDKTGAAASAQAEDGKNSPENCSDCRQCTGQAVAVIADSTRVAFATLSPEPPATEPLVAAITAPARAPYDGRGPPSPLLT